MTSPIQAAKALEQRSGRKALKRISRSNGDRFFCQSPGNLATSGVAPSNHCNQSSLSECIASPKPLNCFRPSNAFILGQSCSGIHSWRGPMLPARSVAVRSTRSDRPQNHDILSWRRFMKMA